MNSTFKRDTKVRSQIAIDDDTGRLEDATTMKNKYLYKYESLVQGSFDRLSQDTGIFVMPEV